MNPIYNIRFPSTSSNLSLIGTCSRRHGFIYSSPTSRFLQSGQLTPEPFELEVDRGPPAAVNPLGKAEVNQLVHRPPDAGDLPRVVMHQHPARAHRVAL